MRRRNRQIGTQDVPTTAVGKDLNAPVVRAYCHYPRNDIHNRGSTILSEVPFRPKSKRWGLELFGCCQRASADKDGTMEAKRNIANAVMRLGTGDVTEFSKSELMSQAKHVPRQEQMRIYTHHNIRFGDTRHMQGPMSRSRSTGSNVHNAFNGILLHVFRNDTIFQRRCYAPPRSRWYGNMASFGFEWRKITSPAIHIFKVLCSSSRMHRQGCLGSIGRIAPKSQVKAVYMIRFSRCQKSQD